MQLVCKKCQSKVDPSQVPPWCRAKAARSALKGSLAQAMVALKKGGLPMAEAKELSHHLARKAGACQRCGGTAEGAYGECEKCGALTIQWSPSRVKAVIAMVLGDTNRP